jgi:hypothetical protein
VDRGDALVETELAADLGAGAARDDRGANPGQLSL